MKKCILYTLLIVMLLFSSCQSVDSINESTNTPSTAPTITDENIVPPKDPVEIHILTGMGSESKPFADWNDYLKDKYNLILEYTYTKQILSESISTFDGLVIISSYQMADMILENPSDLTPINEILEKIPAFTTLPGYMQKAYTTNGEDIYSIIFSEDALNPLLNLRRYNNSVLKNLGFSVPQTTNELLETLVSVKESFPTKTPMVAHEDSILISLLDILGAYGISNYTQNLEYFSPIQYTYDDSSYGDITTTPNMVAALEYIKHIADINILELSAFDINAISGMFNNSDIVSVYSRFPYFPDDTTPTFDVGYGYYLTNNQYIHAAQHSNLPLITGVMGGATTAPDSLLNAFISAFYSDIESITEASLGVSESNMYSSVNDSIILAAGYTPFHSGNFIPINLPRLIDTTVMPSIRKDDPVFNERVLIEELYINELSKAGIYKPYEFYHLLHQRYFQSSNASQILNNHVKNYLQTSVSLQEFLEAYTMAMKKSGTEDNINQLNEKLGLNLFSY